MSLVQRYYKVILTVSAIVVVPSAIYGGVVLRDKFSPESLAVVPAQSAVVQNGSDDRQRIVQAELQKLLDEREGVQRKIDDVKARIARRTARSN